MQVGGNILWFFFIFQALQVIVWTVLGTETSLLPGLLKIQFCLQSIFYNSGVYFIRIVEESNCFVSLEVYFISLFLQKYSFWIISRYWDILISQTQNKEHRIKSFRLSCSELYYMSFWIFNAFATTPSSPWTLLFLIFFYNTDFIRRYFWNILWALTLNFSLPIFFRILECLDWCMRFHKTVSQLVTNVLCWMLCYHSSHWFKYKFISLYATYFTKIF